MAPPAEEETVTKPTVVGFKGKEEWNEPEEADVSDEDEPSSDDDHPDLLKKIPKRLRAAESNAIVRHHEKRDITFVAQLALLICKCIKMVWRHKIVISLELMAPVIGVTILAIYTATLELDNDPKPIIYSQFGYDPVNLKDCKVIHIMRNSPHVDDILAELRDDKKDIFHLEYNYVTTVDFEARLNDGTLCAVINFMNLPVTIAETLPTVIRYEIRLPAVPKSVPPHPITGATRQIPIVSTWQTNRVFPSGIKVGPRNRFDNTGGIPGYYTEGFLFLQHKIDCILLKLIFKQFPARGMLPGDPCSDLHVFPHFQRFPYPPYQHVNLLPIVAKWLPFVLVLSYITFFSVNTWLLVKEKEVGMKGYLEYYNIAPWKQWLSWITYRMALHSLILILVSYILTSHWAFDRAVINKTSTGALYFFLLTYVLNCLCASCLFSTFFYRAQSAFAIAATVWLLSFLPTVKIDYDIAPNNPRPNDQHFSAIGAALYCFLANPALTYGFQVIANSEVNSNGITMDTMLTERFDLGHVILCLNFTSFLYILVASYIERISPTSNAREEPLPLRYFLYLRWWKSEQFVPKRKTSTAKSTSSKPVEQTNPLFFQRNPKKSDHTVEITLTNATREVAGRVGITRINLRCVSGEIVAILGPQKSGKTILWSVCAGLLAVSSGGVFLKKRNLKSFVGYARANIGICPQIHALYDYLTVEEHFSFFVQIKGAIIAADAYEEIEDLIIGLDLEDIRKVRVRDLTPGQKRLVQIGIAFASGSKIILLDEPTEGMDVPMKRTAWRFIDSERSVRTILLFTKNTEEASYVGDRVVVLINGEVYARGTSAFIKSTFDGGYQLEISTNPKFDRKEVLKLTKEVMPRAKLLYSGYQQVKLLLPDEYTPFFPSYFQMLQERKEGLGIRDLNISFVPFEEILKNIMKLSVVQVDPHKKHFSTHWRKVALFSKIVVPFKTKHDVLDITHEGKFINSFRQFRLLVHANAAFAVRRWKWFLAPCCLMVFFVFFGPFVMQQLGFSKLEAIGGVELNFHNFENPRVLFKCQDNHKLHAEFCESVLKALRDMGLTIDNATTRPMDRQLLSHYVQTVTAQDLRYDLAVDVKFAPFANDVVLYFDNQPLHVLAIGSRFFTKLLYLRMREASIPKIPADSPQHEIQVINRPLPYTIPHRLRIARSFVGPEWLLGTALTWSHMFFLPSIVGMQFAEEKNFKILLKIAGVNIYIFWFTKLFCHIIFGCILTLLICPVYYALGYTGFDNFSTFFAIFVSFLCYGVTSVAVVFIHSFVPFIVRTVRTTFFYIWMIAIAMGPIPWTLLLILTEELYDEQETIRPWLKDLNNFLMLLPGHALAVATHRITLVSVYVSQCEKVNTQTVCRRGNNNHPCCEVDQGSLYRFTGRFSILRYEIALLTEAIIIFALIFMMESSLCYTYWNKFRNFRLRWKLGRRQIHPALKDFSQDSSLDLTEFQDQDAKSVGFEVLLNNLAKHGADNRTIVSSLTLGILKNQTFGFIGNEGSGQSKVLRMIAGFSHPTAGDITIEDRSLVKDYGKYITNVSCCPKDHMLFVELTGRETLMLIGTARRIARQRLKELIIILATRLGLEHILDKLVLDYDLGSRRKLSFALALIGKPRVLVLEEPFHEIDPESREQMMNVLLQKRGHTTIILSSSNMELSVSFCDRIALLIDGKLACMGSPEFLMSTYSKGITIVIQLVPEDCSFYTKKGIVYHYERPKGSDESEGSLDEEGQGGMTQTVVQGHGPPIPSIVISGAENKPGAQSQDLEGKRVKKFLALPNGGVPLERTGSSESGGSGSEQSTSSAGSGSSSSGANDALWEQELDPIMEYMEDNFPTAILFDKSVCYLHYHLPGEELDLSDIFKKMEIARIGFELEAYRVGTGTLTQLLGSYAHVQTNTSIEEED